MLTLARFTDFKMFCFIGNDEMDDSQLASSSCGGPMDGETLADPEDCVTPRPPTRTSRPRDSARKRTERRQNWIANQRKVAKNSGQAFINPDGELVVKPAEMRNPCSCKKDCFLKFGEDQRQAIFQNFW